MPKECEGCRAWCYNFSTEKYYCTHAVGASFLYNLTIEWCPCINCLIKPMCRRVCEDFSNYQSMFRRTRRYGYDK